MAVGWLEDGTEQSLRAALASCAPDLAGLPIRINAGHAQSNPLWWSSSAVVDDRFVVKFAWSEVRAIRLWREGMVLERLMTLEPSLPIPELVVLSTEPALVVTRRIPGVPLSWEWASGLRGSEATDVARQIAAFLVRLHALDIASVVGDLPEVHPRAQADTERLRRRFPGLVDAGRAALVTRWCDWVDGVLCGRARPEVLVHGDLHGYNQVWDSGSASLLAVVDFEESGVADRHFDFRYLPSNARRPELVLAVMDAYERLSGQRLAIERIMAWHILTALGDALWRTEAGVALPGGGTATTYVDRLNVMLSELTLLTKEERQPITTCLSPTRTIPVRRRGATRRNPYGCLVRGRRRLITGCSSHADGRLRPPTRTAVARAQWPRGAIGSARLSYPQ